MRCLRYSVPLLLSLAAGCGESSNIVPVTGVLTFKGKPVTNAFVDFLPKHGRPSWGQTDATGRFTLNYDREHDGALIGRHKVSVRMRPTTTAEQEAVMLGKQLPMSKEMAEFYDKYSADKSTKEVVIEKNTKEVNLNWD